MSGPSENYGSTRQLTNARHYLDLTVTSNIDSSLFGLFINVLLNVLPKFLHV